MNSQELWNKLENMENVDILIMATMIIRYLIKKRNYKLATIFKEIKLSTKMLDRL